MATSLKLWPDSLGEGQCVLRDTRLYDSLSLEMQISRSLIFHLSPFTLVSKICVGFYVWSSGLSPHAKHVPYISRRKRHNDTKENAKGRGRQPSWQCKLNTNALLKLEVIRDISQTMISGGTAKLHEHLTNARWQVGDILKGWMCASSRQPRYAGSSLLHLLVQVINLTFC